MREEANASMDTINTLVLELSIRHQKTVAVMQQSIDVKQEMINILLSHMGNMFNTLEGAFDSDESIFVNDELIEIVDAIKSAGIIAPEIQKKRQYWIEKMETRINDLPF